MSSPRTVFARRWRVGVYLRFDLPKRQYQRSREKPAYIATAV